MKEIGKQVNENAYQIHNILDLGSSQGVNVEQHGDAIGADI
jgi:hypothetical protein